MKFINPFSAYKKKPLKYTSIIGLLLFAFLLGRQSIALETMNTLSEGYGIDSPELKDSGYLINNFPIEENATDKVYRCGKSMIYHPTKEHGSFKVCKSKVYELTVEQARKLGMRHCKCSG